MAYPLAPSPTSDGLDPDRVWRRLAAAHLRPNEISARIVQRGIQLAAEGEGLERVVGRVDAAATRARELLAAIADVATQPAKTRTGALALMATAGDEALAAMAQLLAGRIDADLPVVAVQSAGADGAVPEVQIETGVALVRGASALPLERRCLERPHVLIVDGAADERLISQAVESMPPADDRPLLIISHPSPHAISMAGFGDRHIEFWTAGRTNAGVEDDPIAEFAAAVAAVPAAGDLHPAEAATRRDLRADLLTWAAREGPLDPEALERIADLLVEAALDDDEGSLVDALRALQERWARERALEPDGSKVQGRLLAYTGFARWAQARVPPAELGRLGSSLRAREMLAAVASRPGVGSSALTQLLSAAESEISRTGRRLLDLDLVRMTRAGRTAQWETTPKGRAVAGAPDPPIPHQEQVVRCARAVETITVTPDEGGFRLLAVSLIDASRAQNVEAVAALEQGLGGIGGAGPTNDGRILGFASLARAAREQAAFQHVEERVAERLAGRMLADLARHPQTTTRELADRLETSASSISRVGRRLIQDGRVTRASVGRESRWTLARPGQRFVLGSADKVFVDDGRIVALGLPVSFALGQVALIGLSAPAPVDTDPRRVRLLECAVDVARVARLDITDAARVLELVPRLLSEEAEDPAVRFLLGSLQSRAGSIRRVDASVGPPASQMDAAAAAHELLNTVAKSAREALDRADAATQEGTTR